MRTRNEMQTLYVYIYLWTSNAVPKSLRCRQNMLKATELAANRVRHDSQQPFRYRRRRIATQFAVRFATAMLDNVGWRLLHERMLQQRNEQLDD